MGIAIASGLPPAAGLITGIVGGLLVGALGGAPLQVSGPAAGLTVLVWEIVQAHGASGLALVVLLAGLMQVAAGLLRTGRYFQAVPPAVIAGMLAGIGVLIFASQAHVMFGETPAGSGLRNLAALPRSAVGTLTDASKLHSGLIGAVVVALMAAWPAVTARLPKLKLFPAALVAVLSGTVIANLAGLQISYVSLPDSLTDALRLPTWAGLRGLLDTAIIGSALAVAIIASAETLLCASAVDRMHGGPRTAHDRELLAQGLGNTVCGLLGALPMTGVIVRSAANIEAGAKTRASAILHGAWLLALVGLAPFVLRLIPVPALAGLLVFTGYKLLRQDVRSLAKAGRFEVAIFAVTVVGIVTTDLLKGVVAGLALALGRLLWTVTHVRIRVQSEGARTTLFLSGSATFLRLPELMSALNAISPTQEVHVDLDGLSYIDHAALEAIAAWEKQHTSRGGRLSINWSELHHRAATPRPKERSIRVNVPDSTATLRGEVTPHA
jgi:MFS superfamily sulfate permease-like transporter